MIKSHGKSRNDLLITRISLVLIRFRIVCRILNATVKDNILFGRIYDEKRFDLAIYASNMEDDLKILPGGILTEIGERGINLR